MAGVHKFESGRGEPGAGLMVSGPFDLPVISESLEERGDIIHFIVGIKRVLPDAHFIPLAHHNIHRIVEDTLDQEVAEFREENMRLGEMADRYREGADMVVVAMANRDGID